MTKEDIVRRLSNGEDSASIAKELEDMLNDAIQAKNDADTAAAKRVELQKAKEKDAKYVADTVNDFLRKYASYESALEYEDIVDMADFFSKMKPKVSVKRTPHSKTTKVELGDSDIDAAIDRFLDTLGLK